MLSVRLWRSSVAAIDGALVLVLIALADGAWRACSLHFLQPEWFFGALFVVSPLLAVPILSQWQLLATM
jgi:hypothetical protein